MAKRIRRLECYGYADQNLYIGIPNVDLSDIHETNREQDKEILEISGATSTKANQDDLSALSGKVDTVIEAQRAINKEFNDVLVNHASAINSLEDTSKKITDSLNSTITTVNEIADGLEDASNDIASLASKLDEHIASTSASTKDYDEAISNLEKKIDGKTSISECDERYSKKDNTYTKDEVDAKISEIHIPNDYVTEEWVLSKGYITSNEVSDKYETKADASKEYNAINGKIGSLEAYYNTLNTKVNDNQSALSSRIDSVNDRITTITSSISTITSSTEASLSDIRSKIDENKKDIVTINDISLPSKASKADLDSLATKLNAMNVSLEGKVNLSDYTSDKVILSGKLDALQNSKLDKADLTSVNQKISDVDAKVDKETAARKSSDKELSDAIEYNKNKIDVIVEENITRDANIKTISGDLQTSIEDTKKTLDGFIDDAHSYTDAQLKAVTEASKLYTDDMTVRLRNEYMTADDKLEAKITSKVDKDYVDKLVSDTSKSVLKNVSDDYMPKTEIVSIEAKISDSTLSEMKRAKQAETDLANTQSHTANVVKALTDWDGDDKVDYTDSGNGIIDVMHRELHKLVLENNSKSLGIITTNTNEIGFGQYNVSNTGILPSEQTIFSIGVGESDIERKNAIEIRKNGDIYINSRGQYICLNTLIGALIDEVY